MNLFKRKTNRAITENAFGIGVSRALERKQKRLARYLGRKTQYWNRSSKIIALALFCLLFGGCCLLLLIKAIIHF